MRGMSLFECNKGAGSLMTILNNIYVTSETLTI